MDVERSPAAASFVSTADDDVLGGWWLVCSMTFGRATGVVGCGCGAVEWSRAAPGTSAPWRGERPSWRGERAQCAPAAAHIFPRANTPASSPDASEREKSKALAEISRGSTRHASYRRTTPSREGYLSLPLATCSEPLVASSSAGACSELCCARS